MAEQNAVLLSMWMGEELIGVGEVGRLIPFIKKKP